MLQTLLRIRLDELWIFRFESDERFLGIGWLLAVWIFVGLTWAVYKFLRFPQQRSVISAHMVWIVPPIILFAVSQVVSKWLPQGIPVYGYGFMLFLGFITAGWTAARRARRVGLDGNLMWDLGLWGFFAGIVGARLFYLVQKRELVFADKQGLGEYLIAVVNLTEGGLVFYGGAILGTASFLGFCYLKKLSPLAMADVIAPSFFLALALGRIGCLFNGCCFGDRCELPWAITFPQASVPFDTLVNRGFLPPDAVATFPMHPTQIYSALNALLISMLLAAYFPFRNRDGAVLAVAWLVYPVTRFLIEALRSDELGQFGTELTISQWVSMGLLVGGLVYMFWLTRKPALTVGLPVHSRMTGKA